MVKQKFSRNKPHLNVATIGMADTGKSMLTAALTQAVKWTERSELPTLSYEQVVKPSASQGRRDETKTVSTVVSHIEYESRKRHWAHLDCPGNLRYVKGLFAGMAQCDAAILVLSGLDGVPSHTQEYLALARQAHIDQLIVFINKADAVHSAERLDRVEVEIRSLLYAFHFDGGCPVIRGSALESGLVSSPWQRSMEALVDACDSYFTPPPRHRDQPFRMSIADVFSLSGGTVVTGRIESGALVPGHEVEIIGLGPSRRTLVTSVETFGKLLDIGEAGDNAAFMLRGLSVQDVKRGQVLAAPGSLTAHHRFEADLHVCEKQAGGRHTPFRSGYQPQFYLRTADFTGTISLPSTSDLAMPGDDCSVEVRLSVPVAMRKGERFAVREGRRTVATGTITSIIA